MEQEAAQRRGRLLVLRVTKRRQHQDDNRKDCAEGMLHRGRSLEGSVGCLLLHVSILRGFRGTCALWPAGGLHNAVFVAWEPVRPIASTRSTQFRRLRG